MFLILQINQLANVTLFQGRCYLSAETLGEMKEWVATLKSAIDKIHRTRLSVPDIPEVNYFRPRRTNDFFQGGGVRMTYSPPQKKTNKKRLFMHYEREKFYYSFSLLKN